MYKKYWIPFPLVDIYFIVWKPKAISKIHNHSKSGCYLFLLKGNIKEEIYSKHEELKSAVMPIMAKLYPQGPGQGSMPPADEVSQGPTIDEVD